MAKLIIDVSGKKALGPKYYGDIYRSAADPNYRYLGNKGEMADGIFNPFIRDGYMSPSNGTFKQITKDSGTTNFANSIAAGLNDPSVNKWFLLRGGNLQVAATPEATDTTSVATTISGTGSDLERYTVNNAAKVFIVTSTNLGVYDSTNGTMDGSYLTSSVTPRSSTTVTAGVTAGILSVVSTTGYAASGGLWTSDGFQLQYTSISGANSFAGVTPANQAITVGATVYQGVAGGGVDLTTSNYNKLVKSGVFMYILNGSYVHRLDGTSSGGATGTFKANVLAIPSNLFFYDAVDNGGAMFFVINTVGSNENARNQAPTGQYPTECAVGVWNKTSLGFTQYIVVPGMRQLRNIYVAPNGAVRLIGLDNNFDAHILEYTGTVFKQIVHLGPNAYPNQWDGLQVGATRAYWYGMDGILYAHGSNNIGDPEVLCKLFDFTTLNAANYSSAASLLRSQAMVLTQNSSTPGTGQKTIQEALIFAVDVDNSGSKFNCFRYLPFTTRIVDSVTPVANIGNTYTMVQLLPLLSEINYIRSVHLPTTNTGTTAIATVKTFYNQSSTAAQTWTISKSDGAKGYKYMPGGKQAVNALQIKIEWNTSQTLGPDDYCPMYFEVDYNPTARLM